MNQNVKKSGIELLFPHNFVDRVSDKDKIQVSSQETCSNRK